MLDFAAIIDAFGDSFAEAIGVDDGYARVMKHRNFIPPKYWPRLIASAKRRRISGVTLQVLDDLAAGKTQGRCLVASSR